MIIGNTVAWVLQDRGDGRTRLIVRTRGYGWFRSLFRKIPVLRELGALIDYVIDEPLHHYMEKGMCIGIAERAEDEPVRRRERGGRRAPRGTNVAASVRMQQRSLGSSTMRAGRRSGVEVAAGCAMGRGDRPLARELNVAGR
jgi:hypothetical protein